jgi:transposase-like protein
MKRRKWNAHAKAVTVIEGLRGKPGAELRTEHQISQSLYYQWRDQFLAQAAKALEDPQRTRKRCACGRRASGSSSSLASSP